MLSSNFRNQDFNVFKGIKKFAFTFILKLVIYSIDLMEDFMNYKVTTLNETEYTDCNVNKIYELFQNKEIELDTLVTGDDNRAFSVKEILEENNFLDSDEDSNIELNALNMEEDDEVSPVKENLEETSFLDSDKNNDIELDTFIIEDDCMSFPVRQISEENNFLDSDEDNNEEITIKSEEKIAEDENIKDVKGLNWASFFLPLFWGIAHNTKLGYFLGWTVLCAFLLLIGTLFVPSYGEKIRYCVLGAIYLIGICSAIVGLFKGNKMALATRKFDSLEDFKKCQKIWVIWGSILFLIPIIAFGTIYFITA